MNDENTFQEQLLVFGPTGGIAGPQGKIGTQGTQGLIGQGPAGNQGYQGSDGAQGYFGAQGIQGLVGDGPPGVQGAQGSQGDLGIGTQGNQGDFGAGTQGNQGRQGPIAGGFNFTRNTQSVTFSSTSPFTATVNHGLGTTPTAILLTDAQASNSPSGGNIYILGVASKNSTSFTVVASDFDTAIIFNTSRTISWMAIA